MEVMILEERLYSSGQAMNSPEIVEIGDDTKVNICSRDGEIADIFVAVGKNDLDVLKWALDHVVLPGSRLFLVHVFSAITYIPTTVGMLSIDHLSKEQMQIYINEENTKRRNLLQKYISLCTDAKVPVDTMLIESNEVAKTIVDLIPVVNITKLVIGSKLPPSKSFSCLLSRLFKIGVGKAAYVQKKAPNYCEVNIVYYDKKVATDGKKQETISVTSATAYSKQEQRSDLQPEINFPPVCSFFRKIQLKIL